jgi:hypothetical protein
MMDEDQISSIFPTPIPLIWGQVGVPRIIERLIVTSGHMNRMPEFSLVNSIPLRAVIILLQKIGLRIDI